MAETSSGQGKEPTPFWKAAAFGDIDAMKDMVSKNPETDYVNSTDAQGYYPLQWTALNNRIEALIWLLDNGAKVNNKDGQSQTALHWAAVRGCLGSADVLLRAGVELEGRDCRGYTASHVAAQYGHTSLLYLLAVHWGADVEGEDNNERTALHWAAYKGFTDPVRLLLFFDVDILKADQMGYTALHWASVRMFGEVCSQLVEAGGLAALDAVDREGHTAADLAKTKGAHGVHHYLTATRAVRDPLLWLDKYKLRWAGALMPTAATSLWGLILVLVGSFVYVVVMFPEGGVTDDAAVGALDTFCSWLAVAFFALGGLYLFRTATKDPGYLSQSSGTSADLQGHGGSAKAAHSNGRYSHLTSHPALWSGRWTQLCSCCKIVQPIRSKHCTVCKRCVSMYDSHCTLVGNCIGQHNRVDFFLFLLFLTLAAASSLLVAHHRLYHSFPALAQAPAMPMLTAWYLCDLLFLLVVGTLLALCAYRAAKNITTFELATQHKCSYLQNKHREFHNPFDNGWRSNLLEFFHFKPPPELPTCVDISEEHTPDQDALMLNSPLQ